MSTIARTIAQAGIFCTAVHWSVTVHCEPRSGNWPAGVRTVDEVTWISPICAITGSAAGYGVVAGYGEVIPYGETGGGTELGTGSDDSCHGSPYGNGVSGSTMRRLHQMAGDTGASGWSVYSSARSNRSAPCASRRAAQPKPIRVSRAKAHHCTTYPALSAAFS